LPALPQGHRSGKDNENEIGKNARKKKTSPNEYNTDSHNKREDQTIRNESAVFPDLLSLY
jgi:hypothetical protein